MAGSLIKIDEEIVTSAVASVTLTGIDSTYDVYMVKMNNVISSVDGAGHFIRVTTSGTPDTTANYDRANKFFKSDNPFANISSINQTGWQNMTPGNDTGEQKNMILYLFNFNNASEYSFYTVEEAGLATNATLTGNQGGGVHTVAQACDGIQIYFLSGKYNIRHIHIIWFKEVSIRNI